MPSLSDINFYKEKLALIGMMKVKRGFTIISYRSVK
jgi:hypothetical protein